MSWLWHWSKWPEATDRRRSAAQGSLLSAVAAAVDEEAGR